MRGWPACFPAAFLPVWSCGAFLERLPVVRDRIKLRRQCAVVNGTIRHCPAIERFECLRIRLTAIFAARLNPYRRRLNYTRVNFGKNSDADGVIIDRSCRLGDRGCR